ncbi:ABC transporter ATP-binding protein [Dongia sp.]|uniref:ABC transporter ATP-binding protein n=1 Tax=Dongia sp. TaxID=1977262 RepID=UPI003750D9FF
MAFLEINDVRKQFGVNVVVKGFTLGIEGGEFLSLLGPSGCGKTTVLRMVAGFESPTSGVIRIDGKDVTNLRPNQRNVGMVFQAYALFPNMTVAENVAFGLKVAKRPAAEIKSRVDEMLNMIKLPHLADRYPYQCSGGQQQRVALARALAQKPKVLLLDEPLSALDAKIRVSLREEIRALQRALGITTIFVTHDQEEALSMSDRVVVMNEGRAEQVGTPFEVYNNPATPFVANFVGTLSVLKGKVLDAASGRIQIGKSEIVASRKLFQASPGDACSVALRPEAAVLENGHGGAANGAARNRLEGTIDDVSFLGSVVRVRVKIEDNAISLDTFNNPNAAPPQPGAPVVVSFTPNDVLVLDNAR